MKIMHVTALCAAGIALAGCATIVNGTTQSVSVRTMPADGAHCQLVNSEGTWYVVTPGSVVVHKTKNDLQVTCTLDGYDETQLVVPAKFQATTAANIIAGGIIGIAVDAASGANYEYPAETVVTMKPVGAPAPTAAAPDGGATSSSGAPTS